MNVIPVRVLRSASRSRIVRPTARMVSFFCRRSSPSNGDWAVAGTATAIRTANVSSFISILPSKQQLSELDQFLNGVEALQQEVGAAGFVGHRRLRDRDSKIVVERDHDVFIVDRPLVRLLAVAVGLAD